MALSKATLIDLNSNELVLDLDADTGITADTDDTIHIKIAGSDELTLTSTAIAPSTSDGQALGTSSLMFSDLFLASGSVLNFNNGDVTLTHGSNTLVLDGGSLDLFEDNKGRSKLVKRIIPKFNSLNMFEVSATSWHQVSEILTDIQRLTLTGWYHV